MSTAVTDQEQAPLDLVEGERLLAKYGMALAGPFQEWVLANGEAVMAALKADQQQYQIACDLVEQTEAERDAVRDDLARVEAERNGLTGLLANYNIDMERLQADLARVEADYQNASQWHREAMAANERLQGRIAELEGSLRPFSEAAMKIDSWGVQVDDDLDLILLDESEVGLTVSDLRETRDALNKAQTPAAS